MSGMPGDLSGDTLRDHATAEDQQRSAGLVTATAAIRGKWTRDELRDTLGALGLIPTDSGGIYDGTGKHETRTRRLDPQAAGKPSVPRDRKPLAADDWLPFAHCGACGRDRGQPCRSTRGDKNGGKNIFWPHPGRKRSR